MTTIRPARRRLVLAFIAVTAVIALAAMLQSVAHRQPLSRDGDVVVVEAGRSPDTATAKRSFDPPNRPAPPASDQTPAPETYGPMLRALDMSADAIVMEVADMDAATRIRCGKVAATTVDRPRHFVYLGVAGLGAIDDGGVEFAQMYGRLCKIP